MAKIYIILQISLKNKITKILLIVNKILNILAETFEK